MLPWLKVTKYHDAQYNAYDHNKVKQNFVTGKTLIFSPEGILFFLIRHDAAKLIKIICTEYLGERGDSNHFPALTSVVVSVTIDPAREKYLYMEGSRKRTMITPRLELA